MAKAPDMKVVVELSRRDRLLLKRIADALDPVTEPKSGPRRLRELVLPTGNTSVAGTPRPDVSNVFRRLAGANEDSRIALTADEAAQFSDKWSAPVNGVQYSLNAIAGSHGEHLDAGYTELALRSGNARRVEEV